MPCCALRPALLGGLVGVLRLEGPVSPEAALAITAGQYLGAGKNPRFGLGMYRIPELEGWRRLPLYPASQQPGAFPASRP